MGVTRDYIGLDAQGVVTATTFFTDAGAAAAAGYSRAIVCATDGCNSATSEADIACRGGSQGMPTASPAAVATVCTTSLPDMTTTSLSPIDCHDNSANPGSPPESTSGNLLCLSVTVTQGGMSFRMYKGLTSSEIARAASFVADPVLAATNGYTNPVLCNTSHCNTPALTGACAYPSSSSSASSLI
jgi:hypothetical protein